MLRRLCWSRGAEFSSQCLWIWSRFRSFPKTARIQLLFSSSSNISTYREVLEKRGKNHFWQTYRNENIRSIIIICWKAMMPATRPPASNQLFATGEGYSFMSVLVGCSLMAIFIWRLCYCTFFPYIFQRRWGCNIFPPHEVGFCTLGAFVCNLICDMEEIASTLKCYSWSLMLACKHKAQIRPIYT